MTLEINVVKNLGNNKVLIEEKDKTFPKIKSCLYLVDENKSDAFIVNRKAQTSSDYIAPFLNTGLSITAGLTCAALIKRSKAIKTAYGAAAAGLTFVLVNLIDKALKNFHRNVGIKIFNAEKVPYDKLNEYN